MTDAPPRRATDTPTWWRRNRLWVTLLLPMLALALAASMFRMTTLYLPWQWSQGIDARSATGTLRQEFLGTDDVRYSREVTVTMDTVRRTTRHGDDAAGPGAQLWVADLTLEAAPDQILDLCFVELVDAAGTRYTTTGAGKVAADPGGYWMPPLVQSCVPPDTPGPTLGFDDYIPATVERPRTWTISVSAALPDGVEPTALRIMWNQPTFLLLQVPR